MPTSERCRPCPGSGTSALHYFEPMCQGVVLPSTAVAKYLHVAALTHRNSDKNYFTLFQTAQPAATRFRRRQLEFEPLHHLLHYFSEHSTGIIESLQGFLDVDNIANLNGDETSQARSGDAKKGRLRLVHFPTKAVQPLV